MQQITVRLPDEMIDALEEEAEEQGVSRSEHMRNVIGSRRDADQLHEEIARLEERLESRETRIDELEEQLARRSQVEDKVDTLAKRVEDSAAPDPPWPIRWVRWFRHGREV